MIDKPYRSLGLGRKLYQAVFDRARSTGVPFVTAEIGTVPYSETSLRFHAAMGFQEVGVQTVRGSCLRPVGEHLFGIPLGIKHPIC